MDDNDTLQDTDHVKREVQRKLGGVVQPLHEQIVELQGLIQKKDNELIKTCSTLNQLLVKPSIYGMVIKINDSVDKHCFATNDTVFICDEKSPYCNQIGIIVSDPPVDIEGYCQIKINEEQLRLRAVDKYSAQVRLAEKPDGSYVVVLIDGMAWEVQNAPNLNLQVGDVVKLSPDNKAIIGRANNFLNGFICSVTSITDKGIEVQNKGENVLVCNPKSISLEIDDRVICDYKMYAIIDKLPHDNQYKLKNNNLSVTWNDIGGLENAKSQLRDALELPFTNPDLFKYYGIKSPRGILLYGPPGCGKTLLARAIATAQAEVHKKELIDSGYVYVKGPELLDKWVGNTEAKIRALFEGGRRHFRQHGYKAVLALDEADALMPQRGTRRSSDVSDTIVPMFLGEMDGLEPQVSEENPIIILMTNRVDIIDAAITRPGRITTHIKVDRPTKETAMDILSIHLRDVPLQDKMKTILVIAIANLFSESNVMYRINNEHSMTLGDCVNGAMLAGLAESAKMLALHRDLKEGTRSGVSITDFVNSVNKIFADQSGLNHNFDILDYCEKIGIQSDKAKVERCFGAA